MGASRLRESSVHFYDVTSHHSCCWWLSRGTFSCSSLRLRISSWISHAEVRRASLVYSFSLAHSTLVSVSMASSRRCHHYIKKKFRATMQTNSGGARGASNGAGVDGHRGRRHRRLDAQVVDAIPWTPAPPSVEVVRAIWAHWIRWMACKTVAAWSLALFRRSATVRHPPLVAAFV